MAENNEIALDVQHIKKSFGKKEVHKDICFQLRKGEILGLLGGSGSGKSVILRSIIGLEKPDSGQIIFQGQDLVSLSEDEMVPIRTKIAYVFQNGALFDSLTVEENLAYPLKEHTKLSTGIIKIKIDRMLELLDLKGANNLMPVELSGGMQKRVGLARAIILEPEIILFDEPTAGLDPTNTQRLLQNIHILKKKGATGIFVTHDIPSAIDIADRIAILSKGTIPIIDTPARLQLSDDPLVKSFFNPEEQLHSQKSEVKHDNPSGSIHN